MEKCVVSRTTGPEALIVRLPDSQHVVEGSSILIALKENQQQAMLPQVTTHLCLQHRRQI